MVIMLQCGNFVTYKSLLFHATNVCRILHECVLFFTRMCVVFATNVCCFCLKTPVNTGFFSSLNYLIY
jgi:hypothetical protein